MLKRYLLLWLILSSLIGAWWTSLFGESAFDPFLASKPWLGWMVAVVMFCVGTLLPTDEVRYVLNRWPLVLGGTVVQYTSMPFLAWLMATLFGFTGDLRLGLIMVGCVPGAMASNVLTMVARGNVSYSVGLTTSATLLSPFVVPIALKLTLNQEASSALLMNTATQLVTQVVVPVVAGFVVCQLSHAARSLANLLSSNIANLSILWIIAVAVASNRANFADLPMALIVALLLINLGGYLSGQVGGRLLGVDSGMRRALMLEIGMQNAGVGVSLATSLFAESPRAALPCGLFAFGCMATGTVLAEVLKRIPASSETAESGQSAEVLGEDER